ncbi:MULTISPECIES: hypothetical protein [Mesonia]|uniref:Uncharacterized protein n=1 Tax=Mesonia oceanica TaxID=2687242 RepID=A0AC61Y7A3_9FLAO|nr:MULTISPECIES: hypothetical protein [Mesonia]MAN27993.1 hypothetical protein [Mesonia sp.]MAQ42477.1 hypothetical protein [Mesonia sp.]MBJ96781.1 hypothetical protein [Flavobacteriaceae bacterium]VVU99239.1 hypothetical protein FVB9532_00491 [Mesonia oceanica]
MSLPNNLNTILKSLKKAFQYPIFTEIEMAYDGVSYTTGNMNYEITITSTLKLFNQSKGSPKASLKEEKSFSNLRKAFNF